MKNKEFRDWAERYLDLWEDQVSAAAADPAIMSALWAPLLLAAPAMAAPVADEKTCLDGEPWQASFETWLAAFQQAISASTGTVQDQGDHEPAADGCSSHDPLSEQRADPSGTKCRPGGPSDGAAALDLSSGNSRRDLDDIARRVADLAADIAALDAGSK